MREPFHEVEPHDVVEQGRLTGREAAGPAPAAGGGRTRESQGNLLAVGINYDDIPVPRPVEGTRGPLHYGLLAQY